MKKLRHFNASKGNIIISIVLFIVVVQGSLCARSSPFPPSGSVEISQHLKVQFDSIEHYFLSQPHLAEQKRQLLLPFLNKVNYGYFWGQYYEYGAKIALQKQQHEQAIKYCFDALKMFQQNRNHLAQSRIYLALGGIFDQQLNHERAIEYYQSGLDILKKHAYQEALLYIQFYKNLGLCHLELDHFNQAFDHLKKGQSLATTFKFPAELCVILQLMGRNYTAQNDYQKARDVLSQAQQVARQHRALGLEMYIANDLSVVLLALNQTVAARQTAQRKLQLAQQLRDSNCINLGHFLIAQSFLAENKLDSALFYNSRALQGALKVAKDSTSREILILQGDILSKKNQAYAAIQALEQAQALDINLASNAQRLKAERLRQEMTVSRAERQIQQRFEAQFHRECLVRYGLFLILVIAALVSLFYLFKISIRQKANQQLKLQNVQIEMQKTQLQQLSQTKDQLFAVVSHDLRSPLLAIQAVLDTLNEPDLEVEDRQHWINLLHQQTAKTSVMLENLLYWANIQMNSYQPQKEKLKLQPVVEDLSESIKMIFAEKAVRIKNTINPEFTLYTDPGMIRMALRNLLANAVKFSHSGQEVEVSAHHEKDAWSIQIKDYGIGMNEDQLHKALKGQLSRFGTKGEVGSGMGLSLVKQFIENQGGQLSGEAQVNQGCSFTITLPVQRA